MKKIGVFYPEKLNNNGQQLLQKAFDLNKNDEIISNNMILVKIPTERAAIDLFNQGRSIYLITVHYGGLCLESTNVEYTDDGEFDLNDIIGYVSTYFDNNVEPTLFVAV